MRTLGLAVQSCSVPSGYQRKHGKVYYKKHNSVTSQVKAILACQAEAATLAMVKTQAELNAVQSYKGEFSRKLVVIVG